MDIKIQSDFSNANLDEMRGIYCSVGWTKHSNEIIKLTFILQSHQWKIVIPAAPLEH